MVIIPLSPGRRISTLMRRPSPTRTGSGSSPARRSTIYGTRCFRPVTIHKAACWPPIPNADGNPLTAQLVSGPNNGQLTLNSDGSFSYTPNAGFWGMDSFTYCATDGTYTSTPATVTITVNSTPVANDHAFATLASQSLYTSVSGDCWDADGDSLLRCWSTARPMANWPLPSTAPSATCRMAASSGRIRSAIVRRMAAGPSPRRPR